MIDDLRQQAEDDSLFDDELAEEERKAKKRMRKRERRFLGMTPFQRFFIALMLFMMVLVLGLFCLVVTQKIIPPFLE